MDADNLVRMANQIGDFFSAMPERDEAKDGIADHLRKFWDPRMREELFAHIDRQQAAGLAPLVLEAVNERRAQLMRTAATKADG
jgi:formate dehydrogenase subunit delta